MDGYKVKLTPLKDKGHLLAVASVCFMEAIVIRNVKLMDGKHGYFISMPQQKNYKGEFIDCVYPLSKEIRKEMTEAVLDAYTKEQSQFTEYDGDDELPF